MHRERLPLLIWRLAEKLYKTRPVGGEKSIFLFELWWLIISSVIAVAWKTSLLLFEGMWETNEREIPRKNLPWIFSRLDNWTWCEQMLDWIICLFLIFSASYTSHSHKCTHTHTRTYTHAHRYAYYTGYPQPTHSNWRLCAISATLVLCVMI